MTGRVASVDGLRGVLAGLVTSIHMRLLLGDGRGGVVAFGCVLGFFVISGYVLTRGWRGHYLGFLARRFVRLWPLYALCMAAGSWITHQPASPGVYVWFPYLAFDRQPPQDPVVWSLYVEAWAMPFMPAIVWLARRQAVAWIAAVALLAAMPWSHALFFGAFFVIGAALSERTVRVRALESAPAQWLGRVSYSLYLSHVLVIWLLQELAPAYWPYLAIPAALVVAECLARLVEAPSIALSRRAGRFVERLGGARAALAPA